MPLDIIKEIIFEESIVDFSAEIIENASMDDLDKDSFLKFMSHSEVEDKLWRPGNVSFQDYLKSINLITSNNKITIAVLTMFGCKDSIRRFLPQAETIVEYRRDSKSIGSDNRIEYHYGFMGYLDIINDGISSFTGSISYSSGLFRRTLDVFNKDVLREALLNAFCHRDYSNGRSIDIKVSTKELTINSPGGFPDGITADNIIIRHNSRNRLIAESLQRWGLVERAGQGFDRMWESSILEAKYGPDISNTTPNLFSLKLNGSIIDESLLKYMEKKSGTLQSISLQQLIAIHSIAIGAKPRIQTRELNELLKNNLIEKKGVGRGTKYHLPKQFFASNNNRGAYTRLKGLSDRTNKELILKHIDNFRKANIQELEDALGIKRRRIHTLLNSLRADGLIKFEGSKRSGVWIKC
jgi:ATP-dependent DNA helicase RecG